MAREKKILDRTVMAEGGVEAVVSRLPTPGAQEVYRQSLFESSIRWKKSAGW